VTVDSEPQGALITEDGAPLGTTPATLGLTYRAEKTTSPTRCWLPFTLGFVDLGTGAAMIWAGTRYWDRNLLAMLGGLLYGGFGFLFGELLGVTCTWGQTTTETKAIPQQHILTLSAGGWTQPLTLRVPLSSKEPRASAVIAQLETADWEYAKRQDTAAAYRIYLLNYPSGRWSWRREAEGRIEEEAWRRAKEQDTYRSYLSDYPKGRWAKEAQNRLDQPEWEQAQKEDTLEAYELYLRQQPTGQWREQALARIAEESDWREACKKNTVDAYEQFLRQHGQANRFADEANRRLAAKQRENAAQERRPSSKEVSQLETKKLLENLKAREDEWEDAQKKARIAAQTQDGLGAISMGMSWENGALSDSRTTSNQASLKYEGEVVAKIPVTMTVGLGRRRDKQLGELEVSSLTSVHQSKIPGRSGILTLVREATRRVGENNWGTSHDKVVLQGFSLGTVELPDICRGIEHNSLNPVAEDVGMQLVEKVKDKVPQVLAKAIEKVDALSRMAFQQALEIELRGEENLLLCRVIPRRSDVKRNRPMIVGRSATGGHFADFLSDDGSWSRKTGFESENSLLEWLSLEDRAPTPRFHSSPKRHR
jgi:hypothetical protein